MASRWYSVNGYKPLSRRENLEQDDLSQKAQNFCLQCKLQKMIWDGNTDSFGILILNDMNRFCHNFKTSSTTSMLYLTKIATYKIAEYIISEWMHKEGILDNVT